MRWGTAPGLITVSLRTLEETKELLGSHKVEESLDLNFVCAT